MGLVYPVGAGETRAGPGDRVREGSRSARDNGLTVIRMRGDGELRGVVVLDDERAGVSGQDGAQVCGAGGGLGHNQVLCGHTIDTCIGPSQVVGRRRE